MNDRETVKLCKALADENRLKILRLLKNGELCACHLLEDLQITQPTLSHHMKLLCDCGLVDYRKEGKWMHYSIAENAHEKIFAINAEYLGKETANDT